jgi:hypothetical protein
MTKFVVVVALLAALAAPADARDRGRLVGPRCRLRVATKAVEPACPNVAAWAVRGRCQGRRLRATLIEHATARVSGMGRWGRRAACVVDGAVSEGRLVGSFACADGIEPLQLRMRGFSLTASSCPSTTQTSTTSTTSTTFPPIGGCDALRGCDRQCETPCGTLLGNFWPPRSLDPQYFVGVLSCAAGTDAFAVTGPFGGTGGLPVENQCTGTLDVTAARCPRGTLVCPRCCPAGMALD